MNECLAKLRQTLLLRWLKQALNAGKYGDQIEKLDVWLMKLSRMMGVAQQAFWAASYSISASGAAHHRVCLATTIKTRSREAMSGQ
jgi:hypothetical protein